MVESARKSLTPEQIEEYKKIGEYMYNNVDYKNISLGSQVNEAKDEDLILYASEALKSGMDPNDLTRQEVDVLKKVYGDRWFDKFDLQEDEIPKFELKITPEQVLKAAEEKVKSIPMSRVQRRLLQKKINKEKEKMNSK